MKKKVAPRIVKEIILVFIFIFVSSGCTQQESISTEMIPEEVVSPLENRTLFQEIEQAEINNFSAPNTTALPSAPNQPERKRESTKKISEKKPVLKNFGIRIEPWDKKTNRAGDFLFENKNYVDNKIFTEFGHKIVNEMGEKLLPEIGFNVPVGTLVISPIVGVVTDVKLYEPSQDYILFMKTEENSDWIVGFEHVYKVKVKAGDKVVVSQELAEVSPSYGRTEFGNVEINVWTGGQNIIKFCPFEFLDESLKPIYEEKINQLAQDWEEFISKDIYQQKDWVAPGCLLHNLTER